MPSNYPGALDSLPTSHVDNVNEAIHASTMNDDADAINKIELELGINPSGGFTDVVTRLNASDAELGTNPGGVYTDVTTRLNTLETIVFNTQSGSTYTLVLADASLCVTLTNATSCTVTVPANANVAFPSGTQIMLRQAVSAGTVTIAAAGGVTVTNPFASLALAGPGAQAILLKIGTNSWTLNGEVA